MEKQKQASNLPWECEKLIPGASKAINSPRKTIFFKTETWKKSSPAKTLSQVLVDTRTSLVRRLKRIRTNAAKIKKAIKETLRIGLIQLRFIKRIRIRPRISVILNAIPINKKVTTLISIPRSQKISSGLDNFYVNDWELGGWIETNILYLVSDNFSKYHESFTRLGKQN